MEKPMPLPLELVLNVITCLLPPSDRILPPTHVITKTLLSFTLVCKETHRLANRYLRDCCVYLDDDRRLSSWLLLVPKRSDLRNVHTISLSPFKDSIDDQPTAQWIRELFFYTCLSLRRLIVSIPFRSLYPENDHLDVRRIMREGFQRLEHIEEFVSVQDELFLDLVHHGGETPVWALWKKLRRLALYNVDADEDFWRHIANMPALETLILTRADSLRAANPKEEYRSHTDRPLKVVLLNVEEDQVRFGNMARSSWNAVDPEMRMTIMLFNVPGIHAVIDPIEDCQDWVKERAEEGTLWNLKGEVVQHLPRFPHPTVAELPAG